MDNFVVVAEPLRQVLARLARQPLVKNATSFALLQRVTGALTSDVALLETLLDGPLFAAVREGERR